MKLSRKIRGLIILLVTSLLCISAAPQATLYRLTIVNRSGYRIAVQLTYTNDDGTTTQRYYLTVSRGEKDRPIKKTFSIMPDKYIAKVYYLETYDPVYGYHCSRNPSTKFEADRNMMMKVNSCDARIRPSKELTIIKL